jgi:hypothetical protein
MQFRTIGECASCRNKTNVEEFIAKKKEDKNHFLCALCAGSACGTQWWHFPGSETQQIMSVICYIGNELIKTQRTQKDILKNIFKLLNKEIKQDSNNEVLKG